MASSWTKWIGVAVVVLAVFYGGIGYESQYVFTPEAMKVCDC